MYFVKWNQEDNVLEASLGGHITLSEAQVFVEEIVNELHSYNGGEFTWKLDYSGASRLDEGVMETFEVAHTYCKLRGASKYTCIARNSAEIEYMTGLRLQQVLEGEEQYMLAA